MKHRGSSKALPLSAVILLALSTPAPGQETFAGCTAEALARIVPVRPDGTFILGNVPADGRVVRVYVTCPGEDGVLRGISGFAEVLANGLVDVGRITLELTAPGVRALSVTASRDRLDAPTETSQLTVIATRPDGTTEDVTSSETGTSYTSSNVLVAYVDQNGLITATVQSGTAVISVVHGGMLTTSALTVAVTGDSDSDELPDDFEQAFACLDPGFADASADPDSDGRTNLAELQIGTDPCVTDTDGDGLDDGQEAAIGSNPILPDSDLDGLLDGQEPNPTGNGDGDGLVNVLDPDQDNDGLPDGIEVRICGNPTCATPTADNDGDGLSNLDEVGLGTDPARADTDGDGLTDSAEVLGGTDPVDPDMDGDGFPDGFETALGSDPKNPTSRPTAPPITQAVGATFSVLNAASPAPPSSAEAVGRIVSVLNAAPLAEPISAEVSGRIFSLLNSALPPTPASAESLGRLFSVQNTVPP